eukprot:XP_011671637.1 PREDICTED: uncharacterized protein LOC105441828 [Strongylocentrotus purpuratus]
MEQIGPLMNCWCMRYEGKHNIGKCLANVVCNFKDIAKTVADRNQIRQCHSWYTGGVVQQPVVHHVHRESLQEAEGRAVLQQKFTSLSENDEIIVTRKVSVGGTEYRPGMTVIVSEMNAMPTFGQVKSILEMASCNFCMSYGQKKKLLTVSSSRPEELLQNLKPKIESKFSLGNQAYTMKLKLEQFQTYVDIDEDDMDDVKLLQNGGTIILEQIITNMKPSLQSPQRSPATVDATPSAPADGQVLHLQCSTSSDVSTSPSDKDASTAKRRINTKYHPYH